MSKQLWRLAVILTWHLHQLGRMAEGRSFNLYDSCQYRLRAVSGRVWLPHSREWWDGQ